jgi:hypothetical protein
MKRSRILAMNSHRLRVSFLTSLSEMIQGSSIGKKVEVPRTESKTE